MTAARDGQREALHQLLAAGADKEWMLFREGGLKVRLPQEVS